MKKYSSVFLVKKFVSFKINRLGNYADAVFLAGSMGFFGICGVLQVISGYYHELFSLFAIGVNLPYFVLGVLTFANWEYLESKFLKLSGARFVVVGLLLAVSYFIAGKISGIIPNSTTLFNMLPRYFSLILVLGLLYKFLNRSNRVLKYMSESSYSVYLLHHPVIVVVSYYCVKHFELPNPVTGFVVVLVLSTLVVYALDFLLIRSTRIGKLLFTGTIGTRRKQPVHVDVGASLNSERFT
jgi:glucan biosynthesis protein C